MLGLKKELEKYAQQEARLNHTSVEFVLGSMTNNLKLTARGDVIYLPHHEPQRFAGNEFDYPFYLIPYEINVFGNGAAANSPMLLEMSGFRQYVRWDSWVEIHPEAARAVGIKDGDRVWIESPAGRVRVRVRVFAGTQSDMIHFPVGLGHTAVGRYAKDKGANPNSILVNDFDLMSGIPSKLGTRVRIYRMTA